jgi:hypothetical protein
MALRRLHGASAVPHSLPKPTQLLLLSYGIEGAHELRAGQVDFLGQGAQVPGLGQPLTQDADSGDRVTANDAMPSGRGASALR